MSSGERKNGGREKRHYLQHLPIRSYWIPGHPSRSGPERSALASLGLLTTTPPTGRDSSLTGNWLVSGSDEAWEISVSSGKKAKPLSLGIASKHVSAGQSASDLVTHATRQPSSRQHATTSTHTLDTDMRCHTLVFVNCFFCFCIFL